MEKLILIAAIAFCCGLPIIVAIGESKFGRKPDQGSDGSTSLEQDQSQADGLPNKNLGSIAEEDGQAGRDT